MSKPVIGRWQHPAKFSRTMRDSDYGYAGYSFESKSSNWVWYVVIILIVVLAGIGWANHIHSFLLP